MKKNVNPKNSGQCSQKKYSFKIRTCEIAPCGRATLAGICTYLQEAAALHAHALNVASPQLQEQGITWVLARLHVKMQRMPGWQDEIIIETWPSQIDRLYAVRDFRIMLNNEEIGVATSAWVLIDLKTRRPLRRFPPEILHIHPQRPQRALADPFAKMRLAGELQPTGNFAIRAQDIDMNNHVNNVVFISLLQDNLPPEQQNCNTVPELEIEFRGEAFLADTLLGFSAEIGGNTEFHHSLKRQTDDSEVIRAITKLRLEK